jgi:hypothetical protein
MNNFKKKIIVSAISALAITAPTSSFASSFGSAIDDGTLDVNFRYRAESVDQDNALNNALANTLKSRITIKTGSVAGLSLLVEGDNTLHITDGFFDKDGTNTDSESIVLDQETTQLNQAYLQYASHDSVIKAGNQRINLDNQRHVGGVGFRQDEATFDAISVTNKSIDNTAIFAAFANNRNSITNTNTEESIALLNIKYSISPELAITGYYYDISDLDKKDSGKDLSTLGLRATGTVGASIKFEAEIATQEKATNSADTSTLYYNLSAGKKLGSVMAKVGYEVFGSDSGAASFGTPLGTNHKFMGWTDSYLQADGNGLQDISINAVTKISGVKLVLQAHKFDAVEGSSDLGSEIGFVIAKKFKNYGANLKVSQFMSSDDSVALGKVDATKLWLTGTAKF